MYFLCTSTNIHLYSDLRSTNFLFQPIGLKCPAYRRNFQSMFIEHFYIQKCSVNHIKRFVIFSWYYPELSALFWGPFLQSRWHDPPFGSTRSIAPPPPPHSPKWFFISVRQRKQPGASCACHSVWSVKNIQKFSKSNTNDQQM